MCQTHLPLWVQNAGRSRRHRGLSRTCQSDYVDSASSRPDQEPPSSTPPAAFAYAKHHWRFTYSAHCNIHCRSSARQSHTSMHCVTVRLFMPQRNILTNLNEEETREGCRDGCQWIRVILMIQPLHVIASSQYIHFIICRCQQCHLKNPNLTHMQLYSIQLQSKSKITAILLLLLLLLLQNLYSAQIQACSCQKYWCHWVGKWTSRGGWINEFWDDVWRRQ